MKWPEYPLSRLAERFLSGGTPSTKIPEYWTGFIPWITGADIVEGEVVLGRRYINEAAVKKSATNIVPKSSLLMVTRTGVGKIALAPTDIAISQDFTGIVLKQSIQPQYALLAIKYRMPILLAAQRGATIKGVTRADVENLKIPIPALSEQQRIVEILDQADALRRKRAEADTKAARILATIFYKMFGDPLSLVYSGEGVPLAELEVDMQNGFACGEKDVADGVPHLRMNNIDDAGVLNLELVRTVPLDRNIERYRLIERDVLFMGTNSEDKIGKTCLFLPPDEQFYLFSNHLIRLRITDSRISPEYLASFLHLLWSKKFFTSIAKRWVNQSSVAQSSLAALRIPLPGARSLRLFTTTYQSCLTLRTQHVRSRGRIEQIFAVLLHLAFIGNLTAKWREVHMKKLLTEMEAQARELRVNT